MYIYIISKLNSAPLFII